MPSDQQSEQDARGIVIVGAGGFGREVRQYVRDTYGTDPNYFVKGFIDDSVESLDDDSGTDRILGDSGSYDIASSDRFVIAVGEPRARIQLAERLSARGAVFLSVVHPLAYVSHSARIGHGCVISPFASVGALAEVGDHSVLTFYASVGHDAVVGRSCALSPHAVTNGGSRLGDGVFLGAHAVVNPLQQVGDGAKIAAGAVVYRRVPANSLASGNPAKVRPQWPVAASAD